MSQVKQAARFNELIRHREALDIVMGMSVVICNRRLFEDLRKIKQGIQHSIHSLVENEVVLQ